MLNDMAVVSQSQLIITTTVEKSLSVQLQWSDLSDLTNKPHRKHGQSEMKYVPTLYLLIF
jgi:hypothetical protein